MKPNPESLREIADALETGADRLRGIRCAVGFDGFIDNLYRVVRQRQSPDECDYFETIDAFGRRVLASAGKSSDTEIVLVETRPGGNAPNMAASLAALGLDTACVGLLGWPEPEPIYGQLSERCLCLTVGSAAVTQAFEFNDGKLMFGCMGGAGSLTWDDVKRRAGPGRLAGLIGESSLVAVVNWSYLYHIGGIVRGVAGEIASQPATAAQGGRALFFDLADISTRSRGDILQMTRALADVSAAARTVLGLNENEAAALCAAFGLPVGGTLAETAANLSRATGAGTVVIHSARSAASAGGGQVVEAPGFPVAAPRISTGGGDNFNGGYCAALMLGLAPEQCLLAGSAASALYVREGSSCTAAELAAFLREQADQHDSARQAE